MPGGCLGGATVRVIWGKHTSSGSLHTTAFRVAGVTVVFLWCWHHPGSLATPCELEPAMALSVSLGLASLLPCMVGTDALCSCRRASGSDTGYVEPSEGVGSVDWAHSW